MGNTVHTAKPKLPDNAFTKFYRFLANMGLVLHDDPPRVIDLTGRDWGEPMEGLALSIRELKRDDPGEVSGISVVMKNLGASARTFSAPPWTFFYEVEGLQLTPYGRQSMDPLRRGKDTEITIEAGGAVETELPIGTLYDMRAAGEYGVRISCRVSDGAVLRSNEIVVRV